MSGVWQCVEGHLNAGQRLFNNRQYQEARSYIEAGLALAEKDELSHTTEFNQYIKLKLTSLRIEYACGNVDFTQTKLHELYERYRWLSPVERTPIWLSLIQHYAGVDNTSAIQYSKEALGAFDWELSENPSKLSMLKEIMHTRLSLEKYRGRTVRMQKSQDQDYEALCEIMMYLLHPLLISNGEALIHLYARFIRYGLAKGLNEPLALIIGLYEQVVYRTLPQLEPVIPIAMLNSLEPRNRADDFYSLHIGIVSALSYQLTHPIESNVHFVQAMSKATETGKIDLANLALVFFLVSYSGDVSSIVTVLKFFDQFLSERTSTIVRRTVHVSKQYVRALQDEAALRIFIAVPQTGEDQSTLGEEDNYSCGCRLEAAYLSGHYREALHWAHQAKNYQLKVDWNRNRKQECYEMLAHIGLYPDLCEVEQKKTQRKLRSHLKKMRSWQGVLGYGSAVYLLLMAEWKRMKEKPSDAIAEYMEAIKAARQEKQAIIEGIACERLAICYEQEQVTRSGAMISMLDACAAFSRWGITLKVTQIRTLHADLLRPMSKFYHAEILEAEQSHTDDKLDASIQAAATDDSPFFDEEGTASRNEETTRRQDLLEPLTAREMEILATLAEGLSNRDIADKHKIAETTVKTHTTRIFGKLGVKSRGKAVAKAREFGLID